MVAAPSVNPLAVRGGFGSFPGMKTFVVLLASAVLASAQTPAPPPRVVLPGTKANPTDKTAPGTKAAPGAKKTPGKDSAKKEEPPAKIEGIEIARGAKGFLGIQIVESNFKLSFYDAKKKPVAVDVARAVLRWDPKYKVGQERIVLNPSSDGKSLAASRSIRPPYNFKLFITLLKDSSASDESPVGESFVIDFKQ